MRRTLVVALLLAACSRAPVRPPAELPAVEWVALPAGTIQMEDRDNPGPARPVSVKGFEIARTPVTNAQYRACVKSGACAAAHDYGERFDAPDQPIVGVTWSQAEAFSRWAGGRLPSEAEWEYAARSGGRGPSFPATCEAAVVYQKGLGFGCGRNATWPVCSKPKGNTLQGLCDMSGEVAQWVEDAAPGVKGAVPLPVDGSARPCPSGECGRIIRGTAWDDSEFRGFPSPDGTAESPDDEFDYVGFRPVRDLPAGR